MYVCKMMALLFFGSGRLAGLCRTYTLLKFVLFFIFRYLCMGMYTRVQVFGKARGGHQLFWSWSSGPLQEQQYMFSTKNYLHIIFHDVFYTTALISVLKSSFSCLHN